MKKIIIIIFLAIALFLSGCSCCEPKPCKQKIVHNTVYKTKIVKVPTTCDIPEPTCDFKGEGYTPAVKAVDCIVTLKKYIDACKGKKLSVTDAQ